MIAAEPVAHSTSSRSSMRRIIVIAIVVCWFVFASEFPFSLQGTGILVFLAMVALDVALWISTGWLAFMPTSRLDERQTALRDRAYRVGFRLVGTGVVAMVILAWVGSITTFYALGPQPQSFAEGFSARTIIALIELLAIAPTAVVAWFLPADDMAAGHSPVRWLPVVAVVLVAAAWVTGILTARVQLVTATRVPGSLSMDAATCGDFDAVSRVAGGLGGVARLQAEICWNGQQAFAVGDPALPRPASLPAEEFAHPMPGLTRCAPQPVDTDFARIDQQCLVQIDGDGTLHYTVISHMHPLPYEIGSRVIRIQLVVTRDGKVVTFS